MNAQIQKILQGPGIYGLLFVLGDILMIPTGGPNLFAGLLVVLAVLGAGRYFWTNLPRLRGLRR